MTKPLLPKDQDHQTIQVLGYIDGTAQKITTTGGTHKENATPFDAATLVITFNLTAACYVKFGATASVTATINDHYLAAGEHTVTIGKGDGSANTPYMSILPLTGDAIAYVSERG